MTIGNKLVIYSGSDTRGGDKGDYTRLTPSFKEKKIILQRITFKARLIKLFS